MGDIIYKSNTDLFKKMTSEDYINEVYMKYRISRLILENNYYNYLFND